jgi:hypothetical protein
MVRLGDAIRRALHRCTAAPHLGELPSKPLILLLSRARRGVQLHGELTRKSLIILLLGAAHALELKQLLRARKRGRRV